MPTNVGTIWGKSMYFCFNIGTMLIYGFNNIFTVTIPLLSFGMVQGWLSPMISVLQSPSGPAPVPYTSSDISWMTSVTYITAIIFGAPMGYLTDRYGRKIMALITTLSLIVSTVHGWYGTIITKLYNSLKSLFHFMLFV